MNTRITMSIITLAVLSLGAGLAPLQAAQAEKPARIEVRKEAEDARKGSRAPSTYQPAWRDRHDSHHRYDDSRHRYDDSRHRYDDWRDRHDHVRRDDRGPRSDHHHPARRYYYPPRGYVAPVLPRNVVFVRHQRRNYWYGGGVWYRPHGTRYIVVAPPVGVFVPVLPSYYSTRWSGGVPYYYANDVYYVWRGMRRGYQVVAPPRVP